MSKQANVKYKSYSPSKLESAVRMVSSGSMSRKMAARQYGIPRTTLVDKLSGKTSLGCALGRSTILTMAEEQVLENYIKDMARVGYPVQKHELLGEVKRVLDHDGRATPFRNNTPGKDWFYGFCRRHPDLALRTPCTLGHQRSLISKPMIDNWFSTLYKFLQEEVNDWESLLKDPRRFFNADESGFPLCLKTGRVLAEKGVRHVYQVANSSKQQITVMACFNAFGEYVSPMIIYPGERFRDVGIDAFQDALYGHSDNGWIDSKLFYGFLKHVKLFIDAKGIKTPILLFVDGHSTHMSLESSQYCHDNGIILYCLLENATHVLQPCDVGFFGPLKSAWKKQVKTWQVDHLGEIFTKKHFPGVFQKAWSDVTKIENAIHGFQRCGLYPLDAEKVDQSRLNPSKLHAQLSKTDAQAGDTKADNQLSIVESTPSKHNEPPQPQTITTTSGSSSTDLAAVNTVCNSIVSSTSTPVPSSTNSPTIVVSSDRQQSVSSSFDLLKIPEMKKKTTNRNIRSKLPKALSGKEALKLMKERRDAKIAEEENKKKRKEERELKKKQREEEKERKRREREEKRKKRELEKLLKEQRKRKATSSSSSESDGNVSFMDTDDDFDELRQCPGCGSDEGSDSEWVHCSKCPRHWHITCTGDAILIDIPIDQLPHYPFVCEMCL